jgi:hypothetical protein
MTKFPRLLRDICALAVAATSFGAGVDIADWKHLQEVTIRNPGVVRVPLPAATLDAATEDYRDLRLLDPAGQEQSFLLEGTQSFPPEQRPVARFDSRIASDATELTIAIGTNAPLDSIELDSPHRNFIKAARVEISSDGENWEGIATGLPLFRQSGSEQLTLSLGGRRAPHVRVTVDDARSDPIPFTRAVARLSRTTGAADLPLEATVVRREEYAGETLFTLALEGRNATLSRLSLETSTGAFTRRVSVGVRELRDGVAEERILATGTLYRIQAEGMETREQLDLPLHLKAPSRELLVHIHNGDAPPLQVEALRAYRRAAALVFHANRQGTHLLLSGNPNARSPNYDLAGFARELRRANIPSVAPSRLEPNPSYSETDTLADVPVQGAPVDLDGWRHSRVVTLAGKPVQELELDLGTLSRARRDLGDLRVVQDGRQVPFLIEYTRLFRAIELKVDPANDPKQPRMSRWSIALPRENLPLHRLTLTTSTPVFERSLRVFEHVETGRGDTVPRAIAHSVWRKLPGRDTERSLTIPIEGTVQTKTLFVETDNGDNPAIAIDGASVTHPVVRLVFKAPTADAVTLYYGNGNVTAPRYDLHLMASQLLAAPRGTAQLGTEQAARDGFAQGALRGLRGGPIFWVSLALVVIVLLVVVARHLPKPEEPVG